MNHWRMAFRIGSRGKEVWPDCYDRGVAAIGYYTTEGEPVVKDCSKLSEDEYEEIWRRRRPEAPSSKNSLKNLAYRMKKGDIIYVKQGPYIVGRGVITKEYEYDPEVLKGTEAEWEHFVTVEWERDFPEFRLDLGANLITVLRLDEERLQKIHRMESQSLKEAERREAVEGQRYASEASFRVRNRTLIEAKKANSDYSCEVCKMSFEKVHGTLGSKYIVAHHIIPIGGRAQPSKTTLDDIALVCSNCHDMLHRIDPPLSVSELRRRMNARLS